MLSILNLYILRSWAKPFIGMFILVNAIFFIQKVTIWLPKLTQHDAPMELIVSLFVSTMVLNLTMTIPVAYFFAVIMLSRDLQSNSEIDAMYAGGRSIINIFAPIFWVGVLLTFVMLWLTMELAPASHMTAYNTVSKLKTLKAEPDFQPKKFISDIDGFVIYFDGKNKDGSYANLMLTDSRRPKQGKTIYFAEKAVMSRIDSGLAIRLFNGSQLDGEKEKIRSTNFSLYDIVVPIDISNNYRVLTSSQSPPMMGAKALFKSLYQENVSDRNFAHWHFRIVVAFSVLVLFFFAIPISLRAKRSKQGGVFISAIMVMWIVDQVQFVLFKKIELSVAPWWSLWVALGLFISVGVWMFLRVNKFGVINFPSFKQGRLKLSK